MIQVAVEGVIDAAIVKRLASVAGVDIGPLYVVGGKPQLINRIVGYNKAAVRQDWFVLTDLDSSHRCAPNLVNDWLPDLAERMNLRVAVHATESWMMADSQTCAQYFQIPRAVMPGNTENFADPKSRFLDLIRQSRSSQIQRDMLPTTSSGRRTGRNYAYRVIDYVQTRWQPVAAARQSESLRRALAALERIALQ